MCPNVSKEVVVGCSTIRLASYCEATLVACCSGKIELPAEEHETAEELEGIVPLLRSNSRTVCIVCSCVMMLAGTDSGVIQVL